MKNAGWIAVAAVVAFLLWLGSAFANFYDNLGGYAEFVAITRNIIIAFAAFVGAIVAVRGLEEWKRQFKAKNEYQVAKNIMLAVVAMQRELESFCYPMVWAWDSSAAASKLGVQLAECDDKHELVFRARLKDVADAESRLMDSLIEARVLWGEDVVKKESAPLRQCVRNVTSAFAMRFRDSLPRGEEARKQRDQEFYDKRANVQGNIEAAVTAIEKWLHPKLKL